MGEPARLRLKVRHYEVDNYGHVNHANYVHYLEVARVEARNAVTGEAVSGPLDGAELRPVPATQAYLNSWRQLYPGGWLWRAPP